MLDTVVAGSVREPPGDTVVRVVRVTSVAVTAGSLIPGAFSMLVTSSGSPTVVVPMVVTANGSPMVGAPIVVASRGSPTTVVEPMVVFAGGSQGWEAHQTPSFPSPSQVPVTMCFWLWMVGEKGQKPESLSSSPSSSYIMLTSHLHSWQAAQQTSPSQSPPPHTPPSSPTSQTRETKGSSSAAA